MRDKHSELVDNFNIVINDLLEKLNKKYYGLIVNEFLRLGRLDSLIHIEIPVLNRGLYEQTFEVRDKIAKLFTNYNVTQHEYNSCSFNTLIDDIFNTVRQTDIKYKLKFHNRMAQFYTEGGDSLKPLDMFLYASTLLNSDTIPINDLYGITRYDGSKIISSDDIKLLVSDMHIADRIKYLFYFKDSVAYKALVTRLELECLINYATTFIGVTNGTHIEVLVKYMMNKFLLNYITDTIYNNKDFVILYKPTSLITMIGSVYNALHNDSFTIPISESNAFIENILIDGLVKPEHLIIKPTHKLDLQGLRYRMANERLTDFDKACKKLILKGVITG